MRIRSLTVGFLSGCLVFATLPARAEMIGTAQLLAPAAEATARAQVDAVLARGDVQQQLVALGIAPADAAARVAALTDAELQALAGQLETLPAGAGAVEVVLLVLIILLVLELAGAIDIFKQV